MERVNVLIDVKLQQFFVVQILEQSSPKHPALHVHVPVAGLHVPIPEQSFGQAESYSITVKTFRVYIVTNVRSVKKDTKRSSNTLLHLVSFFTTWTLFEYLILCTNLNMTSYFLEI